MLGYPTFYNQTFIQEPKIVPYFSFHKIQVDGVAAGANHCLAWSQEGKLYSWGKSGDGCLGYMEKSLIGGGLIQAEPKMIEALAEFDITSAAAGSKHSMALTTCGRVF